jgi:7-carboxy-7-deazaguanine synthase
MIINNVYEQFLSIQGEGLFTGKLSYFFRFVGCNMLCKFCDSTYANKYDAPFHSLNLEKYLNINKTKYVVITGGEPLLPQNEIQKVVKYLINKGFIVTIETNGSIFYDNFIHSDNLYFSISPKLSNSIPSKKSKENYQIQKTLVDVTKHMVYRYITHYKEKQLILKFVVNTEDDINEIMDFLYFIGFYGEDKTFRNHMLKNSTYFPINKDIVYLMPQGLNQNQLDIKKKKMIVELCKKYGFNYSPRIQIDIYNDKKGV